MGKVFGEVLVTADGGGRVLSAGGGGRVVAEGGVRRVCEFLCGG